MACSTSHTCSAGSDCSSRQLLNVFSETEAQPNPEQQESIQAEPNGVDSVRPESIEPIDGSALDWLSPNETIGFTEGERYLVSLAASPSELTTPLRTSLIQVDDPYGNARIDSRWYEPRIIEEDCAFKTDQASIPFLRAVYLPGEPHQSTAGEQFAAFESPLVFGIELSLFDTRGQRDSFAKIMKEAAFFANQMECSMLDDAGDEGTNLLFPSVEEIPAPDVGYPGFGIRIDSDFQTGLAYQYSVGEWALLKVSVGSTAMQEGSREQPTLAAVEPLLRGQIDQLKSAGLG